MRAVAPRFPAPRAKNSASTSTSSTLVTTKRSTACPMTPRFIVDPPVLVQTRPNSTDRGVRREAPGLAFRPLDDVVVCHLDVLPGLFQLVVVRRLARNQRQRPLSPLGQSPMLGHLISTSPMTKEQVRSTHRCENVTATTQHVSAPGGTAPGPDAAAGSHSATQPGRPATRPAGRWQHRVDPSPVLPLADIHFHRRRTDDDPGTMRALTIERAARMHAMHHGRGTLASRAPPM